MIKKCTQSINYEGEVAFDRKQCLTAKQRKQACENIGVASSDAIEEFDEKLTAGLVVINEKATAIDQALVQTEAAVTAATEATELAEHAAQEALVVTDKLATSVVHSQVLNTTTEKESSRFILYKDHMYAVVPEYKWNVDSYTGSGRVLLCRLRYADLMDGMYKSEFEEDGFKYLTFVAPETSDRYTFRIAGNEDQDVRLTIYDITSVSKLFENPENPENIVYYYGNYTAEGNDNSSAQFILNTLIPSHYYSLILDNSVWSVDNVTKNAIAIQHCVDGKWKSVLEVMPYQLGQTESYVFKTDDLAWRILIRADVGTTVKFKIADVTDVMPFVSSLSDRVAAIENLNTVNHPSISFFQTIAVIGASYESGVVYTSSTTSLGENYPKSWPQIMARNNGISAVNYSYGGCTTRSWLGTTNPKGVTAMLADEPKELYIINLGSNDTNNYGIDYLGTSADIGTDADTFYGKLSKIITTIQAHAPNAKIIVDEIRTNNTDVRKAFNEAIRVVAAHYSLPTIVVWADPLMTDPIYTSMVGGHPRYMGYAAMAGAYQRMIEQCMRDNSSYFNAV